jgi:hypothetical protein
MQPIGVHSMRPVLVLMMATTASLLLASCALHAAAGVKGCRTPARARGKAAIGTDLRAGVGQASGEETAASAKAGVEA